MKYIGEQIGKYRINRLIGEGGMAAVYEGEHEMLGTKVAVKILNPILTSNEQIHQRFRNEAKLMASLNHPNITKVMDFEENETTMAIVMEYLEGEDLSDYIQKNGKLSDGECERIFRQVLPAFSYAHKQGVVHRDIKPSNIYILNDGSVKILDFGIAKILGEGNEMTQTGTQMGTPIYMSPEQVRSEKNIDHRSDIYSLGVTMYYALNGTPPYDGKTTSQFDIFNKIVHEPLPLFTIKSEWNHLVNKACLKERDQRFQNCDEWINLMNRERNTGSSRQDQVSKDKQVVNNLVDDKTIVEAAEMDKTVFENKSQDTKVESNQKQSVKIKDDKLSTNKKEAASENNIFAFVSFGFGCVSLILILWQLFNFFRYYI